MKIHAVVPAAGIGSRMGARLPKQYLPLVGRPMIEHTLQRLLSLPMLSTTVVALHPHDQHWSSLQTDIRAAVTRVEGGAERASSVLAGLLALSSAGADELDLVLVHDAARPCVQVADIEKLLQVVAKNPAQGGLLANPVRDTMKRANQDGQVRHTESRDKLWHALTPQVFQLGPLHDAITQAMQQSVALTDESSAMEWAGFQPQLVAGGFDNIKVTLPEDVALAERILLG